MNPEPTEKQHCEKRRWHAYIGALAVVALLTMGMVAFYHDMGLTLVLYVAVCLTMTSGVLAWCIYDSMARGLRLSHGDLMWIWLLGPIFVPAYFYRSRGIKGAAKSLFGLSLYIPLYALYFATWPLTVVTLTWLGYFSTE